MRKLTFMYLAAFILGFFPVVGFANTVKQEPLQTVSSVDLNRYLGKWYEIASIPQRFQEGCAASSAEYSLRSDGDIKVINSCRLEDGSIKVARGKAWVVDEATNAKLKVRFFWPFSGDYWIIELADDYSYAVVGHPDREYLWILSRTAEISPALFDTLMERIENRHGYDISQIVRTLP
jgi:apolipoprotein D and lipocalin family protein